jgi:hypothetical protein
MIGEAVSKASDRGTKLSLKKRKRRKRKENVEKIPEETAWRKAEVKKKRKREKEKKCRESINICGAPNHRCNTSNPWPHGVAFGPNNRGAGSRQHSRSSMSVSYDNV